MLDLKALERPTSPEEAVRLFAEAEGAGLYVAGGTVIVGAASPNLDYLVDLTRAGLAYERTEDTPSGGYLAVGAMVRVADLARSAAVADISGGVLCEAASVVANHTIRNRATVGGNILSWPYPSDLPPALLALDARVVLRNADGEREIGLEELYRDRRNVFRKGDLLVEARVPLEASGFSGAFEKIGRKRLDVAIANCAVALRVEDGAIRQSRVALNGVGPVPLRAREAERSLVGVSTCDVDFEEAARLAAEPLEPRSDHRASAEYRKKIAAVLVRRALVRAAGRVRE
jgi:CO/xanthine dehydrogenase FAD-binding subunit